MKLILSGGGSGKKSEILDKLFAEMISKKKPLLYIPIAIDQVKHPLPDCLKWLKGTFDNLGIKNYEMWSEKEIIENKNYDATRFGGIYIGGGNTYYLLNRLNDAGFFKVIKSALDNNVPIYGGSAGAIIFGKSILTSSDENKVALKKFGGQNILNGLNIACHYKTENDEKLKTLSKNIGDIIALPETSGILIEDNKCSIIGKDNGFTFKKSIKSEVEIGRQI